MCTWYFVSPNNENLYYTMALELGRWHFFFMVLYIQCTDWQYIARTLFERKPKPARFSFLPQHIPNRELYTRWLKAPMMTMIRWGGEMTMAAPVHSYGVLRVCGSSVLWTTSGRYKTRYVASNQTKYWCNRIKFHPVLYNKTLFACNLTKSFCNWTQISIIKQKMSVTRHCYIVIYIFQQDTDSWIKKKNCFTFTKPRPQHRRRTIQPMCFRTCATSVRYIHISRYST